MLRALISAFLVALVAVPAALAEDPKLHPAGGGAHTYVAWKAQEGLPDHFGEAHQALYFQRLVVAPATDAAAIITGFEGQQADLALTGLSFDVRDDGVCTLTAPRWAIFVRGRGGKQYLVNIGCALGLPLKVAPNWTRRFVPGSVIRARLLAAGKVDALRGRIEGLSIVFGRSIQDKAFGRTWLDNIRVIPRRGFVEWSFAGDNGDGGTPPGRAVFTEEQALALDEEPSALDEMSNDDVWASLTDEERALAEAEPTEGG